MALNFRGRQSLALLFVLPSVQLTRAALLSKRKRYINVYFNYLHAYQGFPDGLVIKNPPVDAGDTRDAGSIPELGRSPGGGRGNPLQCSCLENPHGRRSLAGYSPWGHKESDTTEVT